MAAFQRSTKTLEPRFPCVIAVLGLLIGAVAVQATAQSPAQEDSTGRAGPPHSPRLPIAFRPFSNRTLGRRPKG